MKYVCLFFVFLLGCGKETYQNIKFKPYVDRFSAYYSVTVDVNMIFSPLSNNITGVCLYDNKEIQIDPRFWENENEGGKEQLIFHELGHCVLRLPHDASLMDDHGMLIPASIMYPHNFGHYNFYQNHRDYYFQELKKYGNK